LDEIDKIGSGGYQGDPSAALLEVLDPEQNSAFLDHYLDVPVDLSQVVFVLTGNVLDDVPEPLRDRCEVLRLSGYIQEEKLEIAKKYLIPRHREEMGLASGDVAIRQGAIREIVTSYAREAGVRSLEKNIKKILRKVATEKVVLMDENNESSWARREVTVENLEQYLGKPLFLNERYWHRLPVGVVTGLAWTALGGATLYVEAITVPPSEKPVIRLTGQAGAVMKESSEIAWNYVRKAAEMCKIKKNIFKEKSLHLHIPEGATPKDGPSAGVTMATALFSLLFNKRVDKNLGMTGELTLTGRVLPVGGIREKVVAARRAKLTRLILPKENGKDFSELPEYIKKGLDVSLVEDYEEILEIVFPTCSSSFGLKQ
jgi:ATP-dependent Lon protease